MDDRGHEIIASREGKLISWYGEVIMRDEIRIGLEKIDSTGIGREIASVVSFESGIGTPISYR